MRAILLSMASIWLVIGCSDTRDDVGANGSGGGDDSDTYTDADADADADTDADADPSSGCGLEPPANGSHDLMANNEARTYFLEVPPGYNPDNPYPIVFGFHGMGTSGEMFSGPWYGNLGSAMGDEAILVYPDALGDPTAWDTERDIPYFDELLAHLETQLCVDASRVFATGHSSGGFFTNSLGCERGDVLRGIAPVSGGGPWNFGGGGCAGPLAAWIAHGENDDTVDFSSGEGSRDFWLEANACDLADAAQVTPPECVAYNGCDAGYPVHWCVYQDGHNWPEFGAQGMWDFFKAL